MKMSLQRWAANGWLRPHKTSTQEISDLLSIVDRDLIDAEAGISPDWRFGIAYNAALKLAKTILSTWRHAGRRGILLNMTT